MGDLLNYQSDNNTIVELLDQGIHFSHHLLRHFNIQQGQLFPVVAQSEEPNIHIVRWGIENPIISEGPRLTYIFGPSIENQESLKKLIRHQRILIPVKKFIHRRTMDEPNVIIEHPQNNVMWMAGVWYEGKDGEKAFALITQNSVEQHRKQIRRIPIFLNHQLFIDQWLDKKITGLNELHKIMFSNAEPYISNEAKDLVEI